MEREEYDVSDLTITTDNDNVIVKNKNIVSTVEVKIISDYGIIPKYQTSGSSGVDLHSTENKTVKAGETVLIKTGLKISMPEGVEAQIRPRSGLALKKNVGAVFGTIDSDYRNYIGVIFHNFGNEDYEVNKGDRIAQMVFSPVIKVYFKTVKELDETTRGDGGFGSTGK